MHVIIYDDPAIRAELLPLTYTRPVGLLRVGIDTIADKWRALLPGQYSWAVAAQYLAEKYPADATAPADALHVAGHILPTPELAAAVAALEPGECLMAGERTVAYRDHGKVRVDYPGDVTAIEHLYDIFLRNGAAIAADFGRITAGATSAPLSDTNTVIGPREAVFVAEGASVEGAFINTTGGPVYIGPGATVMEGSMLRGPLALCEHSQVNMGTKVYGDTTIGPHCKVGGELNNVVMLAYSNKAHDGFLGNAVIGQWCNIGAGAVASNLKNDYTPIKLWNYPAGRFLRTDLQFCGLIMADHSKAGINTMFNTATVLGVGVNIHGSGFPRNFVASFSEGSTAGYTDVSMTKFFDTARRMMARRGIELTEADERIFYAIRDTAEAYK